VGGALILCNSEGEWGWVGRRVLEVSGGGWGTYTWGAWGCPGTDVDRRPLLRGDVDCERLHRAWSILCVCVCSYVCMCVCVCVCMCVCVCVCV